MKRIWSIFCSCFAVLLAVSCMSDVPGGQGVQAIKDRHSTHQKLEVEDRQDIKPVLALLQKLEQTAAAYDVHQVFALFKDIQKTAAEKNDKALLISAQEKIQPLLEAFSLEPVSAAPAGVAGKMLTAPFEVRLALVTPEKRISLTDYPIAVSHPVLNDEGQYVEHIDFLPTDENGILSYTPPVAKRALQGNIYFYITYPGEPLSPDILPKNRCAVFPYKVATADKKIPTIISILDYDEHNKPVFINNVTATRVLAGLMKRGFGRIGLDEYRELTDSDEVQLIKAAEEKMRSSVDRFVFGKTHITVQNDENNSVLCTITADISVWHFKQMRKIHHFVLEYTAEGKTKAQAIQLARTNLGDMIIAETLLYSL